MANWRAFQDENNNEIFLNLDLAALMVPDGKGHTLIGFLQADGRFNHVFVQESPEAAFERTGRVENESADGGNN